VLDTISGVSAESRTRLLKHFKSVDMIAQADVSEVARVGRMSAALAKKIQAKLRKDD
jgi:excinuclease UvrABC nuclease subunit